MPSHNLDDFWQEIIGEQIPSQIQPSAYYKVERFLGGGGMSVALFATRLAPDGETPVVLKVLKPQLAFRQDQTALLAVAKEAVALGRLNDRVPTTPFVVRYIDSGNLRVEYGMTSLRLPWVAIEYVHGGSEGTTLEERISRSIERNRHAFDPERAAQAIECLVQGLTAIHEMGIIHRDLKPSNVLCSGYGEDEVHKIADFGIARAVGMRATFGAMQVGTLGYASPEQLLLQYLSPASDVFGLAGVFFNLLTGEDYFDIQAQSDGVSLAEKPERKRISETAYIHPDLRDKPLACAAIDVALANATAYEATRRTSSASLLGQMLVPALRSAVSPNRFSGTGRGQISHREISQGAGYIWTTRRRPDEDRVMRHAAWDGGERCMMITSEGVVYWDGIEVRPVNVPGLGTTVVPHFVMRVDAGVWLVGGSEATVALCSRNDNPRIFRGPDPNVTFVMASGDIDDLIVFVGLSENKPPALHTRIAGRFLKPAQLDTASSITSLSRLDDSRWLVTGRTTNGEGYVVIYEPLQWEVHKVDVPACRAYLGSAAQRNSEVGVVVGTNGCAARLDQEKVTRLQFEAEPDLSAVAIDTAQRIWMGSSGTLWVQKDPGEAVKVAHRSTWPAPFVAIHADLDRVLAISAAGGILEGRAIARE
ncbi:MAG TPA: serine/threonine-protein kinase [Polyangium sp.]|nr:serine/threonine-protein kinase [Polyangium sp.]